MIWDMFMSAIANSAVHLGQDYLESLRTNKSTDFEHVKWLFHISQKLFLDQIEEMWDTTQPSTCRKQKYSFSLIRFFVLALMDIHHQKKFGKRIFSDS